MNNPFPPQEKDVIFNPNRSFERNTKNGIRRPSDWQDAVFRVPRTEGRTWGTPRGTQ